jgi:ribosomal protein S18 acetylase RimI-like enzyme
MSGDAAFEAANQGFMSSRETRGENSGFTSPASAVRRARPNDAPAMAAVHIRTWQSAYRRQLPDDYLDSLSQELPRRTEMWQKEISTPRSAKHELWLAGSDRPVDGFVAFGPARDADPNVTGEIYAIYVSPDRWGRGLGRVLFSHATNRQASFGYAEAILWVLESNTRARRFYEIAGWTADGGTKLETHPNGVQLREVRYRFSFSRKNEES